MENYKFAIDTSSNVFNPNNITSVANARERTEKITKNLNDYRDRQIDLLLRKCKRK